jgi:hypothetical protein
MLSLAQESLAAALRSAAACSFYTLYPSCREISGQKQAICVIKLSHDKRDTIHDSSSNLTSSLTSVLILSPFTPRFFLFDFLIFFQPVFSSLLKSRLSGYMSHASRNSLSRMAKRQTADERTLAQTPLHRVIILYDNCRCLLPTSVQQQLDMSFVTTMLMIQIFWGMTSCGLVQIPFRTSVLLPLSEQKNTLIHKDYYPYTKPFE